MVATAGAAVFEHVGVGVPGLLDRDAGSVRDAVNPGWGPDAVRLAGRLSTALGRVPVPVENDVEAHPPGCLGVVRPAGDPVLLSPGTGVAAGPAMRRARPHGGPGREAGHPFDAAAAGDPAAVLAMGRWPAAVALAVRPLVLTIDPPVVVLADGVTTNGLPVLHAVGRALDRQAEGSAFLRGPGMASRLVPSPADRPVAAVGAATVTVAPPVRTAASAPSR